jgi:hypothetical protein
MTALRRWLLWSSNILQVRGRPSCSARNRGGNTQASTKIGFSSFTERTSDRGIERDRSGRIVVGWVLVEDLAPSVVVEVPNRFVENGEGVALVVDQ